MRIITRAQWGARPAKASPRMTPISARTATCVHHDGKYPITVRTFEQACALMLKDQAYHQNVQGWDDIGYNYLVTSAPGTPIDGMIFEARGRDAVGAHCLDHNAPWIGIQVAIGGGQTPSPAALASVRWLHDYCEDAAGHSLAKKVHHDGFNTRCPDVKLTAWVRAGMPVLKVSSAGSSIPTVPTVPRVIPRVLLAVDGDFGPATRKRLQQWAGVAQDGVLGPQSWRAIQRKVGAAVDGVPGPNTWRHLQAKVGAPRDGVPGPSTYRAIQRYLNTH